MAKVPQIDPNNPPNVDMQAIRNREAGSGILIARASVPHSRVALPQQTPDSDGHVSCVQCHARIPLADSKGCVSGHLLCAGCFPRYCGARYGENLIDPDVIIVAKPIPTVFGA